MFSLSNVRVMNILHIPELEIATDKIVAIIGPSGSGKSTLLRLLNNLQSAEEGVISFRNQLVEEFEPTALRREVVMVPQTPLIYDGTIADNLKLGREFTELPSVNEKDMKQVLEVCHLHKKLEISAKKLSGGEKQRLSLARSLITDRKILLLDEPTSALDQETAHAVIKSVFSFAREKGIGIIMVTHDRTLADSYADEIIDVSTYSLTKKGDEAGE